MTREECEEKILGLLTQIMEAYRQYNPDGKTLLMSGSGKYINVFNSYWQGGDDEARPVDASIFEDGTVKKGGRYIYAVENNG